MILDNFMKWGLKGEFKFVDDDPTIAKPAEVKMTGDKNVRAEVSTIFPSNNLSNRGRSQTTFTRGGG